MNLKKNLTLSVAASLLLMAAGSAHAQKGSRLCGFVSVDTPVKVGLLYEAREKDASYGKQCDEAISKMQKTINSTPQLKAMNWEKVRKSTCESVGGKGFANSGESTDMCEKMEAKQGYKVTKKGNEAAVYEKK